MDNLNNEPDKVEFEYKGFWCVVVRQQMGHLCGYVLIPPTHDGLEWRCRECCKKQRNNSPYYKSPKKNLDAKKSYSKNRDNILARRRKRWHAGDKDDPIKNRARALLRQATRKGYIERPAGLEFHHPDYCRPFYGCWVTKAQHEAIHHGFEYLDYTDYSPQVLEKLLSDWCLAALKCKGVEV